MENIESNSRKTIVRKLLPLCTLYLYGIEILEPIEQTCYVILNCPFLEIFLMYKLFSCFFNIKLDNIIVRIFKIK